MWKNVAETKLLFMMTSYGIKKLFFFGFPGFFIKTFGDIFEEKKFRFGISRQKLTSSLWILIEKFEKKLWPQLIIFD